jgi:CheY-like chemotaxis protein
MGGGLNDQKTVLVVDDYDEIRLVTRKALESFGYNVIEASSGAEAVRVAQEQSPDIILMDLSMPKMDGFATIHQMRRLLGLRDVPIIAVSAHAARQIREDALAAGCRDFVTKPVELEKLRAAVEGALARA